MDRRSSSETLVENQPAPAKTTLKPEDLDTEGEEAELSRIREEEQARGKALQPGGKSQDATGALSKRKTSRYAFERPDEVRGDDEDKANEVQWEDNDPEDPHNWSVRKRAWITFICAFATMTVTFASSAPSSATKVLQQIYGLTLTQSQLITTLFLIGYVLGPFFWAPASELVGRRPVFLGTFLVAALFTLAGAVGQNITTLLVTRALAGFFSSAPLTNCGGVIGDIWSPVGRGPGMSAFTAAVFIGPSIGPMIGGYLVLNRSYRTIFWVMFAWYMLSWALMIVFIPETFSPILLKKRAQRLRKEDPEKNGKKWATAERLDKSPSGLLHLTVIKPFDILAKEPILQVITLYLSIVYAVLYGLFEAFPLIWSDLRGFNDGETGLIFLGILIGSVLGAVINVLLSKRYTGLTEEWHGQVPPEHRLLGAMYAGPFLVVGLFWVGFTGAYASVPWYVPALATIPLGASFCLLFISSLSYIVDTYLMHAASALAANTIIRSALAAVFPLFTTQWFQNMGIQWASTLLGCIAILLAPSPYLFYKYGARIRERSKFAPNLDLKMAKEKKQGKGDEEKQQH